MANKGRPTRSTPVQTIPTDPLIDMLNDLKRISQTTDKKKRENIETVAKRCDQIDNAIAIYNGMAMELQKRREYDEKQRINRISEPSSKLQELLETSREENKKLKRELDALQLRLSEVVGNKIVENNPVIADLSDPHRPISLAEQFKQVYDEEWVNAFEELERQKLGEPKCLTFLVDIIKITKMTRQKFRLAKYVRRRTSKTYPNIHVLTGNVARKRPSLDLTPLKSPFKSPAQKRLRLIV